MGSNWNIVHDSFYWSVDVWSIARHAANILFSITAASSGTSGKGESSRRTSETHADACMTNEKVAKSYEVQAGRSCRRVSHLLQDVGKSGGRRGNAYPQDWASRYLRGSVMLG